MLREAWQAMAANKLRTFLTMLGMVIGVGAVILMLAIGQGAQILVKQAIASMGSNLFIVLSGFSSTAGVRSGSGNAPTLTVRDARAMAELPSIEAVAPVQPGSSQIIYGSNNWNTQVYGTTPSYLDVRDWDIQSGAVFGDAEMRSATRVAILGQTVVQQLFGDEDPVGKTIRIRNSPFVVIGVLGRKGQSTDGRDQDDTILVPLTTAQRTLFGSQFPDSVRYILVQAATEQMMSRAERAMTELLRERHRLPEGADLDFTIRNLSAVAEVQAQTTKVMSLLLGAVASVSLVVGGIGIMNIMLVSVTERTREIGIRKALGATKSNILLQFLIEAVVLCVLGGILGIALGAGGAAVMSKTAGWTTVISPMAIALAFAFSAFVGVAFGVWPARRAAVLDPIIALRYE